MKELNKATVQKTQRTVKILQFGEGNFLRAFVDWQVDIANEKGILDAGVVVVQPIEQGMVPALLKQDCLYHVYLQGMQNKKTVTDIRLVKSVMDAINPYTQYQQYKEYFLSPDLQVIVSNTTEAGIRYIEGDSLDAQPPVSYPAKMTALLYQRFKHFKGAPDKGLAILCCELIEDNGTTLHKYVLQHIDHFGLEPAFKDWVENSCYFCDTLVDRIVPGFPKDNIQEIQEQIGFNDNLVVKAEFYHLWAIGGPGYKKVMEILPLDKAGLHVVFMPSIKQFRDKKVRILNGSHTGMVPIGIQMGCKTVMDAFNTPAIEKFINDMVAREVIPMIEEDQNELTAFAAGILERFYNPHIRHLLESISLNSLSKWETRNYPTAKDNWTKKGVVAKHELFTFAALIALYSNPPEGFKPNDNQEHIAFVQSHSVAEIVANKDIWLEDFTAIDGFIPTVEAYLNDIRQLGMAKALDKFLSQN